MSQLLKRYLERRYVDRNDKAISTFFPGLGSFLRTRKVWNRLKKKSKYNHHDGEAKTITIESYTGRNTTAERIRSFLKEFKHPAIKAAIVQGSIATGEEIAFSDFDGILIIDQDAIQSKRLLRELHKIVHASSQFMKRQDLLQHHGWSILFQHDLKRYPDAELPLVLLERGKLLIPEGSYTLSAVIDPTHQDYNTLYENLCTGILRRLEKPSTFTSIYHTKLLISECLLLPAAFLQSLNNKPVWKADGFLTIKSLLPPEELQLIDEISEIRNNWQRYFDGKSRKSPVHAELADILKKRLSQRIRKLISSMDTILEAQDKRS